MILSRKFLREQGFTIEESTDKLSWIANKGNLYVRRSRYWKNWSIVIACGKKPDKKIILRSLTRERFLECVKFLKSL